MGGSTYQSNSSNSGWSKGKIIGLSLLAIVVFVVIAFLFELGGLQWSRYFGPKKENVKREVFEETKSYNESKIQDLVKYRHQYMMTKDEQEKQAIATTIRHMFADFDIEKLPDVELKAFLKSIKYSSTY